MSRWRANAGVNNGVSWLLLALSQDTEGTQHALDKIQRVQRVKEGGEEAVLLVLANTCAAVIGAAVAPLEDEGDRHDQDRAEDTWDTVSEIAIAEVLAWLDDIGADNDWDDEL